MKITVSSTIEETPRVLQVAGMFDLPPTTQSTLTWDVDLPLSAQPWNVGLVVGPSGCGKSTIARQLWGLTPMSTWPAAVSLLDGFPEDLPIKEVVTAAERRGLQFAAGLAAAVPRPLDRPTVPRDAGSPFGRGEGGHARCLR